MQSYPFQKKDWEMGLFAGSFCSSGGIAAVSACVPINDCFFVCYNPVELLNQACHLSALGDLGAPPLNGSWKTWLLNSPLVSQFTFFQMLGSITFSLFDFVFPSFCLIIRRGLVKFKWVDVQSGVTAIPRC